MSKRVLSVGQCSLDGPNIARQLKATFDVSVVDAESADEAHEEVDARPFDLILINRILDATGEDGVQLLKQLRQTTDAPAMLVSNYDDAQQRAVAAGAAQGFGKNNLGESGMLTAVRPFLADS